MQLGTEDKKVSVHRLVIVFLIAFIVLVIALVILHLNEQQKITKEMNQIQTPEPNQESSSQASQDTTNSGKLSEAEINQIKMDVVTGKREDVPPEIGKPKDLIIKEYLHFCYQIEYLAEKIACYELYYLNNDEEVRQKKQGCEALDEPERIKCFDEYYYKLSSEGKGNFCDAIIDAERRKECELIG